VITHELLVFGVDTVSVRNTLYNDNLFTQKTNRIIKDEDDVAILFGSIYPPKVY